jgi:hypothetical protein
VLGIERRTVCFSIRQFIEVCTQASIERFRANTIRKKREKLKYSLVWRIKSEESSFTIIVGAVPPLRMTVVDRQLRQPLRKSRAADVGSAGPKFRVSRRTFNYLGRFMMSGSMHNARRAVTAPWVACRSRTSSWSDRACSTPHVARGFPRPIRRRLSRSRDRRPSSRDP